MRWWLLAALVACHPDTGTTVANKVAAPEVNVADVLAFLPIDSELVASYDAAGVRASVLGHRLEPLVVKQLGTTLERFRSACGFDPMRTVTRVTLGLKLPPTGKLDGVVVVRGVDGARLVECLPKLDSDLIVTRDREVALIGDKAAGPTGGVAAVTPIGADTVVIQAGPGATHDSLMAIIHSGAPLRNSPTFLEIFSHIQVDASLWAAINGSAKMLDDLVRKGARPRSVEVAIRVTDRVSVAGRVPMATPDQATTLASLLTSNLAAAKPMFERLEATTSGSIVTLDAVLTGPQLDSMLQLVGIRP